MPPDATYGLSTNEVTCEMETTTQRDSSRLPTKILRKVLRHNDNGGRGYAIVSFIYAMVLISFFYEHRPEGLVTHTKDLRQIIHGLRIAAGKIGSYIDVQTAIAVSQFAFNHRVTKNLLQRVIDFAASPLDGLGWSGW